MKWCLFSWNYIKCVHTFVQVKSEQLLCETGIKGIHKSFFRKSKKGQHSKYWWNKIQSAIKTNLIKQFCQLDEKCFKWCFNLVLSLPGIRNIAVNCPSPSSGCLGKAHLWCMDLIFRKAGPWLMVPVGLSWVVWRGYCLQLSLLILCTVSGRRTGGSVRKVRGLSDWSARLGVVICPVKWDLWQCGQLETNILSCCCQVMEEAWIGAYRESALLKVTVLMEISLSDLFVPLPHQLCQLLLCSVLKKQNPCWCVNKRVAWKQALNGFKSRRHFSTCHYWVPSFVMM